MRGRAREEFQKDRSSPPSVPTFSRKPLPDPDAYPKDRDGQPKFHLCSEKDFKGPHEVDWQFAGWAKGYGDGEFDLSCRLCGEIGRTRVKPHPRLIGWG